MVGEAPLSLVSAMITPGILILASGSLITSTLTRLARVVDRTRALIDEVERSTAAGDTSRALIHTRWLAAYSRRTFIIERTLQAFYISIALFVSSTLAIALNDATTLAPWAPPTLVVTGILALFVGAAALIYETTLATGNLRLEIAHSSQHLLLHQEQHSAPRAAL